MSVAPPETPPPRIPPPEIPPPDTRDAEAFRARRLREAAFVLPFAGLLLLAPPLIGLFRADRAILGAPLICVYLFTVWGLLILCAFLLSRRLRQGDAG